jgi:hypothetical protein
VPVLDIDVDSPVAPVRVLFMPVVVPEGLVVVSDVAELALGAFPLVPACAPACPWLDCARAPVLAKARTLTSINFLIVSSILMLRIPANQRARTSFLIKLEMLAVGTGARMARFDVVRGGARAPCRAGRHGPP